MLRSWLYRVLLAIGAVTVLSGLGQAVRPDLVLGVVGGEATPASMHFFGIVGMFMVLFGGLLLHALLSPDPQPAAVLWAGLQKFGAAGAVGLGVLNGIFSPLALAVAGFDLLSGVLILLYRRMSRPSYPGTFQLPPRVRTRRAPEPQPR